MVHILCVSITFGKLVVIVLLQATQCLTFIHCSALIIVMLQPQICIQMLFMIFAQIVIQLVMVVQVLSQVNALHVILLFFELSIQPIIVLA